MLLAILLSTSLWASVVVSTQPLTGTCRTACTVIDGRLDCQRVLGYHLFKPQCCLEAGGEYFETRFGKERCECESCENAALSPVCGSDGVTYDSLCALEFASCRFPHFSIRKNHDGSCQETCDAVQCGEQSACAYDERGRPRCVDLQCDEQQTGEPVCGIDGKTYASECALLHAWTRVSRFLTVAHRGSCTSNVTCQTLKCSRRLYVVKQGRSSWALQRMACGLHRPTMTPHCIQGAASDCERNRRVCGNDGHVYADYCDLIDRAERRRSIMYALPMAMCNILI